MFAENYHFSPVRTFFASFTFALDPEWTNMRQIPSVIRSSASQFHQHVTRLTSFALHDSHSWISICTRTELKKHNPHNVLKEYRKQQQIFVWKCSVSKKKNCDALSPLKSLNVLRFALFWWFLCSTTNLFIKYKIHFRRNSKAKNVFFLVICTSVIEERNRPSISQMNFDSTWKT